ncbi:hypothetical protein KUV57_13815 [Epibacterium sp. DP7N7-1]|nr:hypothetical protein [Epibacterium sp. DP7N7-1]
MARMANRTLIDHLSAAEEGNDQLDRMCWAFVEHLDWPLSKSDEIRFNAEREEDFPETRLTTDDRALIALAGRAHHLKLEMNYENDNLHVAALITTDAGKFMGFNQGVCGLTSLRISLAQAILPAFDDAEARMRDIEEQGIRKIPGYATPWRQWSFEKSGARFRAIDFQNRLMGVGLRNLDEAASIKLITKDLEALLELRDNYNRQYGDFCIEDLNTEEGKRQVAEMHELYTICMTFEDRRRNWDRVTIDGEEYSVDHRDRLIFINDQVTRSAVLRPLAIGAMRPFLAMRQLYEEHFTREDPQLDTDTPGLGM